MPGSIGGRRCGASCARGPLWDQWGVPKVPYIAVLGSPMTAPARLENVLQALLRPQLRHDLGAKLRPVA